ncbi:MAG: CPBP family intramembrane glutamic endopeptidase, partial [Bacteroidia bacterium]
IFFGRFPQEKRMFIILAFTSICLIIRQIGGELIMKSCFHENQFANSFATGMFRLFEEDPGNLPHLFFWVLVQLISLLILPAIFLWIVRPKSFSLFRLPLRKSWNIYLWMFLIMLPVLLGVSFLSSFQETYPFLKFSNGINLKMLVFWEFIYALQFIAVEFFFRGFLLLGMLPVFGEASLAVSILPYVMIHFGKPYPEVLGALIAGWVLARLALKTGSIVPGIFLHFGIAVVMDLLSIWQLI